MHIKNSDAEIYYDVRGDKSRQALVFVNSLGTDSRLWEPVIHELDNRYFIIRFDKRGHGLSTGATEPGTISQYADDLSAVLNELSVNNAVICGISIGGLIAQEFYHKNPERVTGLILSNTGYKIGDADSWNSRIDDVRTKGIHSFADNVMDRWFSKQFFANHPEKISAYKSMLLSTSGDGYISACTALRDTDLEAGTQNITVPVVCIAGEEDIATPPGMVQALSDAMQNSTLETIRGVGHLPCLEKPKEFAKIIRDFSSEASSSDHLMEHEMTEIGMEVRRSVLGDAHVDLTEAGKTDFDQPFQEFITRAAWAGVWSRNELTKRERSLLTIALLAALGHDEELAMHIRATINTGASRRDVSEVLLHTAVYAGVPVANNAIKIAKEVYSSMDAEGDL